MHGNADALPTPILQGGVMPQVIDLEREIIRRYVPAKPAPKAVEERKSTEARDAANGAVGGMIIGGLFGVAVLSTMGWAGIPGLFEAILLVACGGLGGGLFCGLLGFTRII